MAERFRSGPFLRLFPQGKEPQHRRFQRALIVEAPAFDIHFRGQADLHRLPYLTAGIGRRLPDAPLRRKRRDAQIALDLLDGSLLVLHDLHMLEQPVLAQQHRQNAKPLFPGCQHVPQKAKGAALLPGNHRVDHLENRAFDGSRGDLPHILVSDDAPLPCQRA